MSRGVKTEAPEGSSVDDDLARLADLLDFCGAYWLGGPDEGLEELLRRPEWIVGLAAAGLDKQAAALREPSMPSLSEHATRFEKLLRVPGDDYVPPYQSAHRSEDDEEVCAAVRCRRIYRAAGYDERPFQDLAPDHLGHQLRFLAAVCRREAACRREGHFEGADNLAGWRRGFHADHVWWWEQFCKTMGEKAAIPQIEFIAALTHCLGSLVSEESPKE